MTMEKKLIATMVGLLLAGSAVTAVAALTPKEKLGETIYHDARLSVPAGQACATCHSIAAGANGIGDANIDVYEGAVAGRFGGRNPTGGVIRHIQSGIPESGESKCCGQRSGNRSLHGRSVLGRQGEGLGRPGKRPLPQPGRAEQPQRIRGRRPGLLLQLWSSLQVGLWPERLPRYRHGLQLYRRCHCRL